MRLSADKLSLERGGRRLFSNLTFALSDGEALIVTGPNGAGKSSLLRALAGFLPLNAGRLTLDGDAGIARREEAIHYLGHLDSLKAALTARENLACWRDLYGGAALDVDLALARLGLPHVGDFAVRALSAGQRRRVALARLMVAHRPLWLLDEPTTALDAAAQAGFAEILRAHLRDGGMIVAATHAPLGLDGALSLRLDGAAAPPEEDAA